VDDNGGDDISDSGKANTVDDESFLKIISRDKAIRRRNRDEKIIGDIEELFFISAVRGFVMTDYCACVVACFDMLA